jgi:RimJ/RimL family protein N-acetyltransferase
MIVGLHTVIRTAEPDDVHAMRALYRPVTPRACFLDPKRELTPPTTDELREVFQRKEVQTGLLYAVEDKQGEIRGFGVLRGAGAEIAFGEIALMFAHDSDYTGPIAEEMLAFLCDQAFTRKRLDKLVAHCLDSEQTLRVLLTQAGFGSDGIQRDVLYARGRWFNLESFSLWRAATQTAPVGAA